MQQQQSDLASTSRDFSAKQMWNDSNYFVFDFETSGILPEYALQPWRIRQGKMWATSLAHLWYEGGRPVPGGQLFQGESPWPAIKTMLDHAIEHKLTGVGWNTAFDVSILIAYGFRDEVMRLNWLDGMLLWKHLTVTPEYDTERTKRKSYSLKQAVREFLPAYAGYEEDVDFHAADPASLKKLHTYNLRDTTFTYILTRMFYNDLAATPERLQAALIEARSIPLVADANLRGIRVDTSALDRLGLALTNEAAAALSELAPHGVTEEIVRSPAKLAVLLFDQWGLDPIKQNVSEKTGKTSWSTDKEVLHELSLFDSRAKTLRQYREALGNKTKFVDAPATSVAYNADGCTHPLATVFSSYTGRMTYSSKQGRNKDERPIGFGLHQEKRETRFRDILVPPDGYVVMEFDAAGQEYRWMAIASGDEAMLAMCLPGEDPHGYMGAEIAHKEYRTMLAELAAGNKDAKEQRQLGKVANLSCGYRTSAKKLLSEARVKYNLPMLLPEATHIHGAYRRTYPGVPRYWARQIQKVRRLGYAETFAGRRVQVVGDWGGKDGWSLESTAINYPIQGTGADQKYLALAVLKPYTVREGIHFAWELHDGLYFYVPVAKAERAQTEIKTLLDNLPYKKAWGFSPPIPLPWDCKVGSSWGQLKEVKF